jgi:hypothetical protein
VGNDGFDVSDEFMGVVRAEIMQGVDYRALSVVKDSLNKVAWENVDSVFWFEVERRPELRKRMEKDPGGVEKELYREFARDYGLEGHVAVSDMFREVAGEFVGHMFSNLGGINLDWLDFLEVSDGSLKELHRYTNELKWIGGRPLSGGKAPEYLGKVRALFPGRTGLDMMDVPGEVGGRYDLLIDDHRIRKEVEEADTEHFTVDDKREVEDLVRVMGWSLADLNEVVASKYRETIWRFASRAYDIVSRIRSEKKRLVRYHELLDALDGIHRRVRELYGVIDERAAWYLEDIMEAAEVYRNARILKVPELVFGKYREVLEG